MSTELLGALGNVGGLAIVAWFVIQEVRAIRREAREDRKEFSDAMHQVAQYLVRIESHQQRERRKSGDHWTPPSGIPVLLSPEKSEPHER